MSDTLHELEVWADRSSRAVAEKIRAGRSTCSLSRNHSGDCAPGWDDTAPVVPCQRKALPAQMPPVEEPAPLSPAAVERMVEQGRRNLAEQEARQNDDQVDVDLGNGEMISLSSGDAEKLQCAVKALRERTDAEANELRREVATAETRAGRAEALCAFQGTSIERLEAEKQTLVKQARAAIAQIQQALATEQEARLRAEAHAQAKEPGPGVRCRKHGHHP